eukprot:3255030-Pyramimonas_sp.AAC.1
MKVSPRCRVDGGHCSRSCTCEIETGVLALLARKDSLKGCATASPAGRRRTLRQLRYPPRLQLVAVAVV